MTTTCVVTHPVIDPHEKLYIDLHAFDMTFNPTGSTVVLWIDSVGYAMSWVATPVATGAGLWEQYARTSVMFVGSSVVAVPPEVALTAGRHFGEPVITLPGGQVVSIPPLPIDVR